MICVVNEPYHGRRMVDAALISCFCLSCRSQLWQQRLFLSRLACSACGKQHDWTRLQNLCAACGKPLFAIVDLAAAGKELTRERLATRERSLWRYRELLPVPKDAEPIS